MAKELQLIDISDDSSFESKIPINSPIQLVYGNDTWMTTLRGLKFKKYILVDTPELENRPEEFESKKVFVRILVAGIVYGYEALILREKTAPPILTLEYPDKISRHNLRKNRRIKLLHPMNISLNNQGELLKGALIDLSDKGGLLAIDSSIKLSRGQELTISSTLPDGIKLDPLLCKTINARLVYNKKLVGVAFNNNSSALRSFHNNCINSPLGLESNIEELKYSENEFYVGQKIALEIKKKPIGTSIRGCWINRGEGYILCDFPPIEDKKFLPKKGDVVVVNYKSSGKKYKTAMELGDILYKTNLWMLNYLIDAIERVFRKHERYDCLIPAKLCYKMGNKIDDIGHGFINDISANGLKIISSNSFTMHSGNIINLSFQAGESGAIEFIDFKVIRNEKKGKIFEYAGQFVNMKDEDKIKLEKFFDFFKKWAI